MRIELLRPTGSDSEWQVLVDGEGVVAFSGPEAEQRAQQCFLELRTRLLAREANEDAPIAPGA